MSLYEVGGYDIRIIQNEMLKILCAIDKVCRENDIRYVLDGGTMLGAIRHKGFIPWDDDADIAMLRDDYEKFIVIANRELPPEYRFECYENTKEYPYNFGKVRAINTVFKELFTSKLKINHGIYIDIFPMDYADESNFEKHTKMIAHLTQLRYYKLGLIKRNKYIPFSVLSIKTINKMIDKHMKYHYGIGNHICKLCHYGLNKPIVSKTLFTDVIEVPFEDFNFHVPREYDSFLTGRYGDYMKLPSIDKQKPCHVLEEVML